MVSLMLIWNAIDSFSPTAFCFANFFRSIVSLIFYKMNR